MVFIDTDEAQFVSSNYEGACIKRVMGQWGVEGIATRQKKKKKKLTLAWHATSFQQHFPKRGQVLQELEQELHQQQKKS